MPSTHAKLSIMLSVLTTPHDEDPRKRPEKPDCRVLFIVESKDAIISSRPETVNFSFISSDEAIRTTEEQLPSAIFVWSQISNKRSADIGRLRDLARVNAIPFIFY